jgi:hypothetical protein
MQAQPLKGRPKSIKRAAMKTARHRVSGSTSCGRETDKGLEPLLIDGIIRIAKLTMA